MIRLMTVCLPLGDFRLDFISIRVGHPAYHSEDFFVEEAAGVAFDTAAAPGPLSAPQQGVDFSGTNVQVLGVDEPDIVKTDGLRVLAMVDNVLHYVDVSGDEPELTDSIRLEEGWNHRMFFSGDRALVFTDRPKSPGSVGMLRIGLDPTPAPRAP